MVSISNVKEFAQNVFSAVFFGWWGEQNVILQWIKAIPFLVIIAPFFVVAYAVDVVVIKIRKVFY